MNDRPIGIFDSGIGGLNVLSECRKLMPNENYVYLADEAGMPYGNKSDAEIKLAAERCAYILFSMNCKALAVACNTATAVAITHLRTMFPSSIIIGLEPAVKPCIKELGINESAVALVTSGTMRSQKFKRLLNSCDGRITPVAAPELAAKIEHCRDGKDADDIKNYIGEVLLPYKTARAVILGCSHYAYVKDVISEFYGGNIKIYDGATGAAERLAYCLNIANLRSDRVGNGDVAFYSTTIK